MPGTSCTWILKNIFMNYLTVIDNKLNGCYAFTIQIFFLSKRYIMRSLAYAGSIKIAGSLLRKYFLRDFISEIPESQIYSLQHKDCMKFTEIHQRFSIMNRWYLFFFCSRIFSRRMWRRTGNYTTVVSVETKHCWICLPVLLYFLFKHLCRTGVRHIWSTDPACGAEGCCLCLRFMPIPGLGSEELCQGQAAFAVPTLLTLVPSVPASV